MLIHLILATLFIQLNLLLFAALSAVVLKFKAKNELSSFFKELKADANKRHTEKSSTVTLVTNNTVPANNPATACVTGTKAQTTSKTVRPSRRTRQEVTDIEQKCMALAKMGMTIREIAALVSTPERPLKYTEVSHCMTSLRKQGYDVRTVKESRQKRITASKLSEDKKKRIIEMILNGKKHREIILELDIRPGTLYHNIAQMRQRGELPAHRSSSSQAGAIK